MDREFIKRLGDICAISALSTDCPMDRHTTFRIGGPADAFMDVGDEGELLAALDLAARFSVPVFAMGNGSNLLVSDGGYRGLIIRFGPKWNAMSADRGLLIARSGALLPEAAAMAAQNGLDGLVFACGIPGSVGGAAVMNAGAYGGQMSDVVEYVKAVKQGERIRIDKDALDYGYRHSALMQPGLYVTEVGLRLAFGDGAAIMAAMDGLKAARAQKQPVRQPSAGSAFKRPQGDYAARLIDACGLKGLSVGGAQVSPMHAGFIVNTGGATASDVLRLADMVGRIVLDKTGHRLELEIKVL